ncbi:E3 ubiquitin-protein ligase MARCHF2-like [Schistocerca nitens]|uniref:E3 ubiquitin-protein ligase MARCHF2-like n=1 Tax=Schistocerca nitens TaxID=7011 RepID=UPI002119942B|nr:E3 ubiquitin-protein ligase MARCHF2-like [Schistocerca nitens]
MREIRVFSESSGELSRSCRICLMGDNGEPLVSPCKCRGSMGMVHLSCLERWLSQHSRNYCELCLFEFPVTRIPRYSVARSLRLWFCHPRVRQSLMEDLLVLGALTFVVAGIVAVCLLGLQYFAAEGLKLGISRAYTVAVISSFMALVLLGYFVIVCLLVRDLVVPWHVWWRRCAVVRIIVD